MTRDEGTAEDIRESANRVADLVGRLERYEQGAADEGATGHAALYHAVWINLRGSHQQLLDALDLMVNSDAANFG